VDVVGHAIAEFPDSGVGLVPVVGHEVREIRHGPPHLPLQRPARADEGPRGVHHPAVDIELVLGARFVPHSDGTTVSIARSVRNLPFIRPRLSVERVEDLEAWASEPAGHQEPVQERVGFIWQPDGQERVDADARVPWPGESIVPVPLASHLFGKRGRG
jgi:hypothetical protein